MTSVDSFLQGRVVSGQVTNVNCNSSAGYTCVVPAARRGSFWLSPGVWEDWVNLRFDFTSPVPDPATLGLDHTECFYMRIDSSTLTNQVQRAFVTYELPSFLGTLAPNAPCPS